MKRKTYRLVLVAFLLVTMVVGTGLLRADKKKEAEVNVKAISDDLLIPGGMPVGIYMETDGAWNGKNQSSRWEKIRAGRPSCEDRRLYCGSR